ncbi:unnamed protein product [Protopolystoma xenopodis]|uniref:RRM domain-containing protein n=1 Tax=Protopolystoma xenopodis TaxID=117903 RepID=A0A3S5FD79_9PLAT|nr:unnamed protein product [Protopolystoma xenopodis]
MEDALEAIREKPKVYLHDRNLVVEPISSSDSHDIHGGILTTGGGFRRNDAINAAPGKMSSDISNLYDRHRREMHASASTSISSDLHHANTGSVIAHSGSVISMSGPNASTSASILGMPVGIAAAAPAMMAAARALGLARGSGNGLVSATGTVPGTSEVLLTDPGSLGGLLGATAAPVRPHRFAPVQPPSTPPHRHRNERPSSPLDDGDIFEADPSATRTLFVGGLEADISETEIHEAFSRFGSAEHVDIKRPATGVNGGHVYAFVRFANVDQAARAKAEMSGRCIRSLHCKIGFGKPIPSTAVYVSGRDIWGRTEALDRLLSR